MKNHLIALLVLVLVSGAALTYFLDSNPAKIVNDNGGQPLFADLSDYAEQLEALTIRDASGSDINIQLKQGRWWLTEPWVIPADENLLSDLLSALAQAKRIQHKTANPAQYSHLGLKDIRYEDSQASLLQIQAKNHQWLLLVGKQSTHSDAHFVREPDKRQSWLIDKTLSLPPTALEWARRLILPESWSDVVALERQGKDGWRIQLDEQKRWILLGMDDDSELIYPSILLQQVSAISHLSFAAIVEPQHWSDATPWLNYEVTNLHQQVIGLEFRHTDSGDVLVRLSDNAPDYCRGLIFQVNDLSAQTLDQSRDDFTVPR